MDPRRRWEVGIITWLIVGVIIGGLARHVANVMGRRTDELRSMSILGAIVGGYVADLWIRGDFVVHFHAVTVAAAVIAAVITAAAWYGLGRVTSPRRAA